MCFRQHQLAAKCLDRLVPIIPGPTNRLRSDTARARARPLGRHGGMGLARSRPEHTPRPFRAGDYSLAFLPEYDISLVGDVGTKAAIRSTSALAECPKLTNRNLSFLPRLPLVPLIGVETRDAVLIAARTANTDQSRSSQASPRARRLPNPTWPPRSGATNWARTPASAPPYTRSTRAGSTAPTSWQRRLRPICSKPQVGTRRRPPGPLSGTSFF
jgi:hypothetical protein